jgi:HEAT repeat protein
MINYDNYAVTLGRAVAVFRRGADAVPEQKVALRALAALARLGGVVFEVGAGALRVGGRAVPSALPGVAGLLAQLEAHDVAELRIAEAATPASLLELLRGVAAPVDRRGAGVSLAERLRAAGVADIQVRLRRRPPAPDPPPPPDLPSRAVLPDATTEALPFEAAAPIARRAPDPEAAVAAFALDPAAAEARARLEAAADWIREGLEQGPAASAVRALARLIELESATPAGELRETLTGMVDLLITDDALRGVMASADADETRDAARLILQRSGSAATALLRTRLMTETDEVAARRTLQLLREQPEGLRSLILLLQHADRAIVRRTASVLASLGVREAVPVLCRLVHHGDATVRAAATAALARLATPQAIELLGELLDQTDPNAVAATVDGLGGPGLGPLVGRLENVARRFGDAGMILAVSHALGRIGTPTAVAVLTRWAAPAGWRFWRRRRAVRLAAVAGLRIAAGPDARRVLGLLSRDRNADVREAASAAVQDLAIAAPARAP